MHQGWLLIGLSLAYLGLLFLIAYVADKSKRRRLKGQPLLYSLSLAVYCTSWTFFGSVGLASRSGFDFLAIYVGPMLLFALFWPLVRRVVRIAKAQNEQLQQLGAVAAEEESLHDIECACSAVLPSPARGEVEEDVH